MEEEHLTLDLLFSMLNSELEQLMTKYSIPVCECRKLLGALDHLTTYYGMCGMHCAHVVAMPTLALVISGDVLFVFWVHSSKVRS